MNYVSTPISEPMLQTAYHLHCGGTSPTKRTRFFDEFIDNHSVRCVTEQKTDLLQLQREARLNLLVESVQCFGWARQACSLRGQVRRSLDPVS